MTIISSPRAEVGDWLDTAEPTDADLRAIEAEWPSIEAELVLLDAEIGGHVHAAPAASTVHRRVRRRRRRILSAAAMGVAA